MTVTLTDEWETLMDQIHHGRYVAHFGPARPISDDNCVHQFLWSHPKRNEPRYARCVCGTWWIPEHPALKPRRPIPWGCFKMVHIGRHIRIPLIDR